MKIETGKVYVNRTYEFLVPCLVAHGSHFKGLFESVHKLAYGVCDSFLYDEPMYLKQRYIYVLIDAAYMRAKFDNLMRFLENQDYFVNYYKYDETNNNCSRFMVILKIPEQYSHTYDMFIQGKYSEMFTNNEISEIFEEKGKANLALILRKSSKRKDIFAKEISEEFNCAYTVEQIKNNVEVALPPKTKEEVFRNNFKQNFLNSN